MPPRRLPACMAAGARRGVDHLYLRACAGAARQRVGHSLHGQAVGLALVGGLRELHESSGAVACASVAVTCSGHGPLRGPGFRPVLSGEATDWRRRRSRENRSVLG